MSFECFSRKCCARSGISPCVKRGEANPAKPIQPIIQVFSEFIALDGILQIPVRCRNKSDIHADGSSAAHAHHLPLLNDPEQFHLHVGRHFRNFVKEKSAAFSKFYDAGLNGIGSRVRSFFVAEEFVGQKLFAENSAVYREQRPFTAFAVLVYESCQELFASPGFPEIRILQSVPAIWRAVWRIFSIPASLVMIFWLPTSLYFLRSF